MKQLFIPVAVIAIGIFSRAGGSRAGCHWAPAFAGEQSGPDRARI